MNQPNENLMNGILVSKWQRLFESFPRTLTFNFVKKHSSPINCNVSEQKPKVVYVSESTLGAVVAKWLSSWIAEQEDRGSIPGLATWIFRDWLSPASKSRYGWKIAKSTLILKKKTNWN